MITPNQPMVCVPSSSTQNVAPYDALTNANYYDIEGSAAFLADSKLTFWGGRSGASAWSIYTSRAVSDGAIPLNDQYYSPNYPFTPSLFQQTPWERYTSRSILDGAFTTTPFDFGGACTQSSKSEFYELSGLEDISCEAVIYNEFLSLVDAPNATVFVDFGIRNACDYGIVRFNVSNFSYNSKSITYGTAIAQGLSTVNITGNGSYSLPVILNPLGATSSLSPNGSTNFFIQSLGPEPYVRFDIDDIEVFCFTPDELNCDSCKTGEYQQPVLLEAIDYWAEMNTRADSQNAIPALTVVPYGPCEDLFKARMESLMLGQDDYKAELLSFQVDDPFCGQYVFNSDFELLTSTTNAFVPDAIGTNVKYVADGWTTAFCAFSLSGATYEKATFSYTWAIFSGISPLALLLSRQGLETTNAVMNQPNTVYRISLTVEAYGAGFVSSGIDVFARDNSGFSVNLGRILEPGDHSFYYRTTSSWNTFAKLSIQGLPTLGFSYSISNISVSRLTAYTPVLIPTVRLNLSSVFKTVVDSVRMSQDLSGVGPFYPIIANALYEYFHFETRRADLNYDPQECFRILITKDYCFDADDSSLANESLDFCITEPYKWITDPCNTLRIGAGQETSANKQACAFGFTYPTVSEDLGVTEWLHLTRVYGELRNPQYDGETITYQDSRGRKRVVYAESREFMEMVVNFSPKWVHNFMRLACRHDFFYINDGNSDAYYFTRSETYSPTWIRTRLVAPAMLEIEVKEQNLRKELCCVGFTGQDFGEDERERLPGNPYGTYGPPVPGEPTEPSEGVFDESFDFTFE